MIEIPVLDTSGEKVGSKTLNPAAFGGRVRIDLLKQAVVAYRAGLRQGTVQTKSRAMVDGSTRKLYRQKGTGRARMGNVRTPVRVGGGHAFHKVPRDFSKGLPRRMRRLARDSAILAKAMSGSAVIVKGIAFDKPQTAKMAKILKAAKADRGVLLTVASPDENMLKSVRNIPATEMKLVTEINAYDVLRRRRLVFTPEAFEALVAQSEGAAKSAEA
jgi:large subunit ribosomal protein L4